MTSELREQLVELALLPDMSREALEAAFGEERPRSLDAARTLGFVSTGDDMELHRSCASFCSRS